MVQMTRSLAKAILKGDGITRNEIKPLCLGENSMKKRPFIFRLLLVPVKFMILFFIGAPIAIILVLAEEPDIGAKIMDLIIDA